MKSLYYILPLMMALLIVTGCDDNTAVVFDHNAALEGYVTFEEATPDTLSAMITVSKDNIQLAETITDDSGYYLVENLASGAYFVSVSLEGFASNTFEIELINNEIVTADTLMLESMSSLEMATRIVDGTIDAGWEPVYTDDHVSGWGPNDFSALYLAYDENNLYVAVRGEFSTSDNTMSMMIDIDGDSSTGINDFSLVNGGDIGNNIRKAITAPEDFGADVAFNSGWAFDISGIVWLNNPSAVDENLLEDVIISTNSEIIEFAISLDELYDGVMPNKISLVAYIGGGGDQYFADDAIPQGSGNFEGTFLEVFTIGF